MKKPFLPILFLGSFLFLNLTLKAQDSQSLLEETKDKYVDLQDFSADLVYFFENAMRQVNSSQKGQLRFAKEKYTVQLPDQQIYCDGKSLWVHIPQENEVTIMNPEDDDPFVLFEIFSLINNEIASFQSEGLELIGEKSLEQFYFTVNDRDFEYSQGQIWINPTSKLIEKITLVTRRQVKTTLEFSRIQINQGLSDSDFVFDINSFKGSIIDFRN